MEIQMTFLDCPAYLDAEGAEMCGLPAEVECRYTASSTSGPVDSAKIRCPAGHWFNGPVERLTLKDESDQLTWSTKTVPQSAQTVSHIPGRLTEGPN
jgi:hypothetical protein